MKKPVFDVMTGQYVADIGGNMYMDAQGNILCGVGNKGAAIDPKTNQMHIMNNMWDFGTNHDGIFPKNQSD